MTSYAHSDKPSQPMWTAKDVARLFGVDPKTVVRWAKNEKIVPVRTPGGHRRYTEAEVRRVYEACGGVWPA
jgi:DNA-binding transcriptional MerR regulator